MRGTLFAVGPIVLAVCGLSSACGRAPDSQSKVLFWAKVAPEQIAEAKKHGVPVAFENDLGMRFVLIPAGTFVMGSPEDEEGRYEGEARHTVRITNPFYMQLTEVTNAQFRRKEPRHDSVGSQGHTTNEDEHPVVRVSWDAASTFATWLTGRNTARSYRLPTEAEWEYACRAGSTTRYHFGDDAEELPAYAWFSLNSGETTHPVAGLAPNAWGLYDVHGNVWEWCLDGYAPYPSRATEALVDPGGEEDSGERALRGGCWSNGTRDVRSAHRFGYEPRCFDTALGFRLVSPLPEPSEK